MLVWSSAENDLVFYIMADIPESTMIKMAEGVQKKIILKNRIQLSKMTSFIRLQGISE